jgi:hypothetical protein
MSRGVMTGLGVLLLLATLGVVSCQALFADSAPIDRVRPAAIEAR